MKEHIERIINDIVENGAVVSYYDQVCAWLVATNNYEVCQHDELAAVVKGVRDAIEGTSERAVEEMHTIDMVDDTE